MILELISSEESEWEWEEDNDGNTYKLFYICPLPWRGKKVFNALDRKAKKSHDDIFTSRRLTFDRARPNGLGLLNWVFKQASV